MVRVILVLVVVASKIVFVVIVEFVVAYDFSSMPKLGNAFACYSKPQTSFITKLQKMIGSEVTRLSYQTSVLL